MISTQPSNNSPRGNSPTATATASAIVAAATSNATIANSRRLISPRVPETSDVTHGLRLVTGSP